MIVKSDYGVSRLRIGKQSRVLKVAKWERADQLDTECDHRLS